MLLYRGCTIPHSQTYRIQTGLASHFVSRAFLTSTVIGAAEVRKSRVWSRPRFVFTFEKTSCVQQSSPGIIEINTFVRLLKTSSSTLEKGNKKLTARQRLVTLPYILHYYWHLQCIFSSVLTLILKLRVLFWIDTNIITYVALTLMLTVF